MKLKRKPTFIYFDIGHVLIEKYLDSFYIKDSVLPTLETLSQHYALGILTNADNTPSQIAMDDFFSLKGLEKYFKVTVTSREVGHEKPDCEIFQEAISKSGVSAKEILFIDDIVENLDGAKACGIDNVVLQKYREESDVYPMIEKLAELLPMLGTN